VAVSTAFAAAAITAALGAPGAVYYLGLTVAGVEVVGAGYARQPVGFGAVSGRQRTNLGAITFPAAGAGGWGAPDGWALFVDASTSSSYLSQGTFTGSVAIPEGMIAKFAAGSITVSA
jgi:hypothetical protein